MNIFTKIFLFQTVLILVVYTLSTLISVPMFVCLELPLIVMEKFMFRGMFKLFGKRKEK